MSSLFIILSLVNLRSVDISFLISLEVRMPFSIKLEILKFFLCCSYLTLFDGNTNFKYDIETMYTHNLDPVLMDFGFIVIRWYSLAYIFGIVIGWWFGKKIISHILKNNNFKFEVDDFDDLISYLIFSIVIGGRIGYVIFYNFEYYISNALEILKIWEGGMSFHGALIGIIIGTHLFSKKKGVKTFFILDIIACVAPIGIFLGRIANYYSY